LGPVSKTQKFTEQFSEETPIMDYHRLLPSKARVLAIAVVSLTFSCNVWASGPTETTLYNFQGTPDGASPAWPVVFDKAGNIYGTTTGGGQYGYGAVFELSPPVADGDPWTETILHSFAGNGDGIAPSSGLVIDGKGNLYGETAYGGDVNGTSDQGAIFKLTPPATQGGTWTESIIYSFCAVADCADGAGPQGGLVFDTKGNLYGTASGGGLPATNEGYGVVFELIRPSGKQKNWTETVLYNFLGKYNGSSDGQNPGAGVIFDKAGNLYGTTFYGGNYSDCTFDGVGCGVVFELSPQGGTWTESVLYAFQGNGDGYGPEGSLVFDKSGALYGTTSENPHTGGNVFKLSPPTTQGGAWTEIVLYNFQGLPSDGSGPQGGVIFVGEDLYGTTTFGGAESCAINGFNDGCGTVFRLIPPKTGTGAWTEKIIWKIPGSAVTWPTAALTIKAGAFYGTASNGGSFISGGVFEVVP
jgi:uncharacterized repeat protein (TIGR03803 family)